MVGQIVQHPSRRCAGRPAEFDGNVERNFVVVFVAAPALRLQHVDQAGVEIFLDRLARDLAIALGLDGALAQLRSQRAGAADQFVGRRNLGGRGAGPQFGNTHWVSSVWRRHCVSAGGNQAPRRPRQRP